MALAKGTNSYATVDEADTYFETRIDVAAWTAATDDQKAAALVTATGLLDDLNWSGTASSDSQALCFPRELEYFDPRKGYDVYLDGSEVPNRVVVATYELAYHLLNNDGLLDDTGSVKDLTLGSIQLSNVNGPSKIPDVVRRHIQPLLCNTGSNAWWRAN